MSEKGKVTRPTNPIFKNISNTLLLFNKTALQKIKNIFDPLWIGRVKSNDPAAY